MPPTPNSDWEKQLKLLSSLSDQQIQEFLNQILSLADLTSVELVFPNGEKMSFSREAVLAEAAGRNLPISPEIAATIPANLKTLREEMLTEKNGAAPQNNQQTVWRKHIEAANKRVWEQIRQATYQSLLDYPEIRERIKTDPEFAKYIETLVDQTSSDLTEKIDPNNVTASLTANLIPAIKKAVIGMAQEGEFGEKILPIVNEIAQTTQKNISPDELTAAVGEQQAAKEEAVKENIRISAPSGRYPSRAAGLPVMPMEKEQPADKPQEEAPKYVGGEGIVLHPKNPQAARLFGAAGKLEEREARYKKEHEGEETYNLYSILRDPGGAAARAVSRFRNRVRYGTGEKKTPPSSSVRRFTFHSQQRLPEAVFPPSVKPVSSPAVRAAGARAEPTGRPSAAAGRGGFFNLIKNGLIRLFGGTGKKKATGIVTGAAAGIVNTVAKKGLLSALGTWAAGVVSGGTGFVLAAAWKLRGPLKKLAKVVGGAAAGAFIFLVQGGLATAVGGLLGTIVGAAIGNLVFPVVGAFVGAPIGAAVGMWAGWQLSMAGVDLAAAGATLGNALGGAMSAATGLAGAGITGAGSVIVFGSLISAGLFNWFTTQNINGAMVDYGNKAPVSADTAPAVVTVNKSGTPETIPDDKIGQPGYTGVKYTVTVTALEDIASATVEDKYTVIGKNGVTLPSPLPKQAWSNQTYTYTLPITPALKDTVVINSFTISGTTAKGKPFAPVTGSVAVKIGNPSAEAFSCPVLGGTPTCYSQSYTGTAACKHCGANYGAQAACSWPGNNMAMDVAAPEGSAVFLPAINGQEVTWKFIGDGHDNLYPGQVFRVFSATVDGAKYVLQLHHMISENIGTVSTDFKSGSVVGHLAHFDPAVSQSHSHIQIQKDGVWIPAETFFTGCGK